MIPLCCLDYESVQVSRIHEFVTGSRLKVIHERPICLTHDRHPLAWIVSYAWAMKAEEALRRVERESW